MKLATLKAGGRDGSPVVVTLSEEWGIDLEAEVAVVTGDVPIGASVAGCAGAIRLVMLVRIEMLDGQGASIFGAIDQQVAH